MSRPKRAAVKDIDIDIADILGLRNIDNVSISEMALLTHLPAALLFPVFSFSREVGLIFYRV